MGIETVAVYSDADKDALHVEMADTAVHIGPPPASESYLVIEKILQACIQTGAEAVHPGYGFLSERAAFCQALKDNGIVFVGLDYLDQEPAAKAYMAEFGITYPSGPDLQSAAARRYGIKGVPETFFINPQGSITDIVIGPIVSQAKMEEYLAKIRPQ